MSTRATITSEVEAIVGGALRERGPVQSVSTYLDLALRDVNRIRPQAVRLTIQGDGTAEYPLGAQWARGFSSFTRALLMTNGDFTNPPRTLLPEQYEVEYARSLVSNEAVGTGDGSTTEFALDQVYADPVGATVKVNGVTQAASAYSIAGDEDASLLTFVAAPAAFAIVASYYVVPTQIRFLTVPSSLDVVIVEFTARHVLTDNDATTTLTDDLAGALAHRAAELVLRAAAAGAAGIVPQSTDTDILANVGGTAGDAYRRLADDEHAAFEAMLGIGAKNGEAVGAPQLVTVPASQNARNNSYLTHPRRRAHGLGYGHTGGGSGW